MHRAVGHQLQPVGHHFLTLTDGGAADCRPSVVVSGSTPGVGEPASTRTSRHENPRPSLRAAGTGNRRRATKHSIHSTTKQSSLPAKGSAAAPAMGRAPEPAPENTFQRGRSPSTLGRARSTCTPATALPSAPGTGFRPGSGQPASPGFRSPLQCKRGTDRSVITRPNSYPADAPVTGPHTGGFGTVAWL